MFRSLLNLAGIRDREHDAHHLALADLLYYAGITATINNDEMEKIEPSARTLYKAGALTPYVFRYLAEHNQHAINITDAILTLNKANLLNEENCSAAIQMVIQQKVYFDEMYNEKILDQEYLDLAFKHAELATYTQALVALAKNGLLAPDKKQSNLEKMPVTQPHLDLINALEHCKMLTQASFDDACSIDVGQAQAWWRSIYFAFEYKLLNEEICNQFLTHAKTFGGSFSETLRILVVHTGNMNSANLQKFLAVLSSFAALDGQEKINHIQDLLKIASHLHHVIGQSETLYDIILDQIHILPKLRMFAEKYNTNGLNVHRLEDFITHPAFAQEAERLVQVLTMLKRAGMMFVDSVKHNSAWLLQHLSHTQHIAVILKKLDESNLLNQANLARIMQSGSSLARLAQQLSENATPTQHQLNLAIDASISPQQSMGLFASQSSANVPSIMATTKETEFNYHNNI